MYRVIPHKFLFLAIAWLVVGSVYALNAIEALMNANWFGPAHAVTIGWLVGNLLLWKPAWRWVWRRAPFLNRVVFPDLNGIWDVEMQSNWPIHKQVIDAAAGRGGQLDVLQCPESDLAALQPVMLEAEIDQSWFKIEIVMRNPANNTPIDRSDVISAEPFPADGLKPSGLLYFFKQRNQTQNLADDAEFYGAARVEYDLKSDMLKGCFWTARMWGRAMNTAGLITFRRRADHNSA